ncbi:protein POF1B [Tiliqua scincoides]|uniref:protein POF1B n=1 Tax=Tiliqua scincoides TaxID=71010 RepID=UPI003462FFE2
MFGVQQQVQPTSLPPSLGGRAQQVPCYAPPPMPCYAPPPPVPSYQPVPSYAPPPCQPCGPPAPPRPLPAQCPPLSRPFREPSILPPSTLPRPCPEPCPPSVLPPPPQSCPIPAPIPCGRPGRPKPLPLPLQCPDPVPCQDGCGNGGGSVVYERVRTYSSPGGKRGPLLDTPNGCSPRAPSPFDATPGYQQVIWSSEPPKPSHEIPSPSLKLSPYSQGSVRRIILENNEQEPLSPLLRGGNNVIYEKTIRKYELLNPDQEKQYQISLQQAPSSQCQVSQPVEQVQVVQQCENTQTGRPCDITSVCVSDAGRGNLKRYSIQSCEPVKIFPEINDQSDSRYFGELLAELNRKSSDLYNCLFEHVQKLGGRRYEIECQTEDIESLIPKGLSESTKQQIRYLLQMRATADKSMRLVLATFSSLREELVHLQDDLGKLETDKELLEKDLAFKACQVKEYETLLASVRENNRQQQQALRECTLKCRSLEEQLLSLRHTDGEREFRLKDLEYSKRALEQEIQNLRLQASSNPMIQTTTDELSSRYVEMINQLREDKDRQISSLRSQLREYQTDLSRKAGDDVDLQMRLHELTLKLEEKEAWIKQQEDELFRLKQEKLSINPSQGVTKTIITKRYKNQYPILGLLSDDYKVTSPIKESQTIVIEKTGEMWKQESFTAD